jgi:hypothetical protein
MMRSREREEEGAGGGVDWGDKEPSSRNGPRSALNQPGERSPPKPSMGCVAGANQWREARQGSGLVYF